MARFFRDDSIPYTGGHLIFCGVVDAPAASLVERYGPPIEENDDFKIKHRWCFRSGVDDAHIVVIYDYDYDGFEDERWFVGASTYDTAAEFKEWFTKET